MGDAHGTGLGVLRGVGADAGSGNGPDADGGAAMSTYALINVPHIVEINGERVEIAELDCRVELVHDGDGWALGAVEIDCFGENGKRRWQVVPVTSPLYETVRTFAYGRGSDELNEVWSDYVTDGGWKARRVA